MEGSTPQTDTAPAVVDHPGESEKSQQPDATIRPRRARKKTNLLAPLALLLGLTLSPFALVFGHIAIGQIRRADQRGAPMAWLAIGLGWLWLVAAIVIIGALVTIWAENPFWP